MICEYLIQTRILQIFKEASSLIERVSVVHKCDTKLELCHLMTFFF